MGLRIDRTSLGRPLLLGAASLFVFAAAVGAVVALVGSARVVELTQRETERTDEEFASVEARAAAASAASAAARALDGARRTAETIAREASRPPSDPGAPLGGGSFEHVEGQAWMRFLAPADDLALLCREDEAAQAALRRHAAHVAPVLRTRAGGAISHCVLVVDGVGVLASPAAWAGGAADEGALSEISRHLAASDSLYVSEWVGAERGRLTYAAPVTDEAGKRTGAAYVTCSPGAFADVLAASALPPAALVSSAGAPLAVARGFSHSPEETAALLDRLGGGGGVFYPPAEGWYVPGATSRLAAARVDGTPFSAAVVLPPALPAPEGAVADASRRLGLAVLGVALAIGTAGVFAALVIARAHRRRVASLVSTIQSHERGEYEAAADVTLDDEITDFARWLNTASLRLRRAANRSDEGGRRLKSLLEATGDAFVTTDADDRIVHVNPRFAEMLHRPAAALAGTFVEELLVPESLGRYRTQLRRRLLGRHSRVEVVWNSARAPHPRTIVSAVPLLDDDGRYAGSHVVVTDLTDRVRVQEETARAEKVRALGEMAGGVAHDFNNVLTVILGNAQYLLLDDLPEEQRQTVAAIERAALEGTETVRRLREFTRARAVPHDAAPFSVNEVVETVLADARRRFEAAGKARGVEYRVEVGRASRRLVRGNAAELVEALANIVENALDAMPRGGTLTIESFDRGEDAVAIRVEDTGNGMSKEVVKKIFDPFFTTKPGGRCPGLGLSIAFGIVRAHRGRIDVKSAPNEGASFTIVLAATASEAAPPPESEPATATQQRVDPRVLLTGGDAADLDRLRIELHALGIHATCVAGASALPLVFDAAMFNVLVLDLAAGDNGWALARQARVARPDIRIVLLTSHEEPVSETQARNAGIDRVLVRPFDARDLHAEIFSVLATPRELAAAPVPASVRSRAPAAPRPREPAESSRTSEIWSRGEVRTQPVGDCDLGDETQDPPAVEPLPEPAAEPATAEARPGGTNTPKEDEGP